MPQMSHSDLSESTVCPEIQIEKEVCVYNPRLEFEARIPRQCHVPFSILHKGLALMTYACFLKLTSPHAVVVPFGIFQTPSFGLTNEFQEVHIWLSRRGNKSIVFA